MIYQIKNPQRSTRYADLPEGMVVIPAKGCVEADLTPEQVVRLAGFGFLLGPASTPQPAVVVQAVADPSDLGAISSAKAKPPKPKSRVDAFLDSEKPSDEPGQETK